MKTTRRQELRTNELSQQIEQIRGSLKDNATTITVVGVVVAALAFGGYWYYGQHSSRLENAYAQLGLLAPGDDPADRIRRLQDVAKEQINPRVSGWTDPATITPWRPVIAAAIKTASAAALATS